MAPYTRPARGLRYMVRPVAGSYWVIENVLNGERFGRFISPVAACREAERIEERGSLAVAA